MADCEIRERYHQLVDIGIESDLTALERFELERIEARLDRDERDLDLEADDRNWELEREQLLRSIEDLLSKLKR